MVVGINSIQKEMCGNEGVLVLFTPSRGCWFGWIDVLMVVFQVLASNFANFNLTLMALWPS